MNSDGLANVSAAAERFFRAYETHCETPDQDTLFNYMEAAHSLNDRTDTGAGFDFLGISYFSALKCLRNFFHHHEELLHRVRLVPVAEIPIVTDLMFLCLVPRSLIDAAIDQEGKKWKAATRSACERTFHWYGPVVNINPCIFNLSVAIFERLTEAGVPLTGSAVERLRDSYEFEANAGHSHYVEGRISTTVADLNRLLANIGETHRLGRLETKGRPQWN